MVIYPGTFDPITNGHLEIIIRSSKLFNKVIVAIAAETPKKTLFSLEERVSMVYEELLSLSPDVRKKVDVIPMFGLLIEFAKKYSAIAIIRGLRALSDFEYEFRMAHMNKIMEDNIETIFLPATDKGHFISSSFVKEIARLGGDISYFVSHNIAENLQKKFTICNNKI